MTIDVNKEVFERFSGFLRGQKKTNYVFPVEHWKRIRTNNTLERIMKEIRRRTRVIGSFPDGESASMLVAARSRHIAGSTWSEREYLNMDLLRECEKEDRAS